MEIDRERCAELYASSAIIGVESQILKMLFDVYAEADGYAARNFLPAEVRYSAPLVRRALLEKQLSAIVAGVGGQTISMHTSPRNRPQMETSHYSLFRIGDLGMTISSVGIESRPPRTTEYRNSLIKGLNIPLEIFVEDEPKDPFLYLLFQHGKTASDHTVPYYAKVCALDTQQDVVWRRNLFKEHAAYVRGLVEVKAEVEPEDAGAVLLLDHLKRLENGQETG